MKCSKIPAILSFATNLLTLVAIAWAQGNNLGNLNPELIGKLTHELKVTPQQAAGGTGAIFGLAKSRLSSPDFAKVAALVPGMDGLLKAAPTSKGGSTLGSLGSLAPTGTTGVASLAGSFQKLGLSPAMVGKFTTILESYLGSKGGPGITKLFSSALK